MFISVTGNVRSFKSEKVFSVKNKLLLGTALLSLLSGAGVASAQTLQEVSPSEVPGAISASGTELPTNSVTPPVSSQPVQVARHEGPGSDVFLNPDDDPLARDSRLTRYFNHIGAKLTLFARQGHAGLFGYFSLIPATHNGVPVIDPKTGKQVVKKQIIYAIPGDEYEVLEGDLRGSNGEPLTLKKLIEIRDGAKAISENLEDVLGGGSAPVAKDQSAPQGSAASQPAPASQSGGAVNQGYLNPLLLPQQPDKALEYPQGISVSDTILKVIEEKWGKPSIDAGGFLKDVTNHTSHFIVGDNEKAPLLYLVVDPRCEYCHALWHEVRPYVLSGKIRAMIILSSAKGGAASLDDAAQILSSHKAGSLWMNGVGNNPAAPVPMLTQPSDEHYQAYYRAVETSNNRFLQKYAPAVISGSTGVPLSMFVSKNKVYGYMGTLDPIFVSTFIGRLTGADDKGFSETVH